MSFIKHATITLLILFVVACLAYWTIALSGRMNVSADGTHWPITDRVLETVRVNSVARHAGDVSPDLPDLADTDLLHEAVVGFEDMCAACHTPPGGSPTAMAQGLNPPATDLAEAARERSPAELFWVTKHGIRMTGMPAWGPTHADAELTPVVALITRFPDFADDDYENLLAAAREAGIEHHHDHHDDDHDHDEDHEHEHHHDHDDEHDGHNGQNEHDEHDEHNQHDEHNGHAGHQEHHGHGRHDRHHHRHDHHHHDDKS
ncbi:cytochrome c [Wenzhouxiangella sp. AB-CW3]|uniref:c-type cytochrome n=1 Tax=Wenzhouxiangella sp. AB-CW3 TaxID=2771012 RepID=UPI00168AC52A|nr:cytochrome c [Wenzhouxiangella sp. AB-CW3]QOC23941.1 cytochrome c [Wenzhouxiangella sp. AB-CW3]